MHPLGLVERFAKIVGVSYEILFYLLANMLNSIHTNDNWFIKIFRSVIMDLTKNESVLTSTKRDTIGVRSMFNVWYCPECKLAWDHACQPVTHYRKGWGFGLRLQDKTCPKCLGKTQPKTHCPDLQPGAKYNAWTVIKFSHRVGTNQIYLCKCDCGTVKECLKWDIMAGRSKGCIHCKNLRYKK